MISASQVQRLLAESTNNENWLSTEIIIPTLHAFSEHRGHTLRDIRFVGGANELGNDIEYYEISGPDQLRFYTGIQMKKGDINQRLATSIILQAEQAFGKQLADPASNQIYRIARWVAACTGKITEDAKVELMKHANKRGWLVHCWDGLMLGELITYHYLDEFLEKIQAPGWTQTASNLLVNFYDPEAPIILAEGLSPGITHQIDITKGMPPTGLGIFIMLRPNVANIPGVSCHVRSEEDDLLLESVDTQFRPVFVKASYDRGIEVRLMNADRKVDVLCRGYAFAR